MKNRKIDKTSALIYSLLLTAIGILYIIVVTVGIGTADKASGKISDQVLVIMEVLTLLSAIAFLLLSVSLHFLTSKKLRIFSMTGLLFMAISTALTCCVHFIGLTVSKDLIKVNNSFEGLFSFNWPSLLFSIDILAWDLFFGLAFLFLGIPFLHCKEERKIGVIMIISGMFSLLGLIALPLNNMNIRFIGIFGYTVLPVIACIMLIIKLKIKKR
jgi:hypothetical protein